MENVVTTSYSAMMIANFIISYCKENNFEINNLRLQKLLYFVQGFYLVNNDKLLFEDSIEKWRYGPVIPQVYHAFKSYGSDEINDVEDEIIVIENNNSFSIEVQSYSSDNIKNNDIKFIEAIVTSLKEVDTFDLVEITHNQQAWFNDRNRIMNGERNIMYTEQELRDEFII